MWVCRAPKGPIGVVYTYTYLFQIRSLLRTAWAHIEKCLPPLLHLKVGRLCVYSIAPPSINPGGGLISRLTENICVGVHSL